MARSSDGETPWAARHRKLARATFATLGLSVACKAGETATSIATTPSAVPLARSSVEASARSADSGAIAANQNVDSSLPAAAAASAAEAPTAWPAERFARALPGDRVTSKVRHLWIRPSAHHRSGWLGYLSFGDSVRLRGGDRGMADAGPGFGAGCQRWYAIEPRGFVCTGTEASLDASEPGVAAVRHRKAKPLSAWPYHYGESLGTPVFAALPAPGAQRLGSGRQVVIGSTIAWVDEHEVGSDTFLGTWDGAFVPRDRVRPYPESQFRGVVLGGGVELPLAFFRREGGGARYQKDERGAFIARASVWPRLSWVALTGRSEVSLGETFHEVRVAGVHDPAGAVAGFCRGRDVAIARRTSELPPTIAMRATAVDRGRLSWLDLHIDEGTLVAYEHEVPVYATLLSPGRGGAPRPGVPPLDTASTPLGTFDVLGKFSTVTMTSSTVATLVHAEVQYAQNFGGPYSLHGAYWHDRFGEKKSGGCVNLAPIDALRMFAWTDPPAPEGWHGMRSLGLGGERTVLWLRR